MSHGELVGVDITISTASAFGKSFDGAPRTLDTVLAHELVHAWRLTAGLAPILPSAGASAREETLTTYLENEYRFARNLGQRSYYGIIGGQPYLPIPHYP